MSRGTSVLPGLPTWLPFHVELVWPDYPTWYHATYLLSLAPVTALAGLAPAAVNRRRAARGAPRGCSRTSEA